MSGWGSRCTSLAVLSSPFVPPPGASHSGPQRWRAESQLPTHGGAGHRASHRRWKSRMSPRWPAHNAFGSGPVNPNLARRCGSVSSVCASAKWAYYSPLRRRSVGLVSKQAPSLLLCNEVIAPPPPPSSDPTPHPDLLLLPDPRRRTRGGRSPARALMLPRA